jgi:hypothetical protein
MSKRNERKPQARGANSMLSGKLIEDMTPSDIFYFKGFQRVVALERSQTQTVIATLENVVTGERMEYRTLLSERIDVDFRPRLAPGHTYTW